MKPIFDSTLHEILNERLDKLEKHFNADVIFYYGPIADSLEKPFRDFIEDLKSDAIMNETLCIFLNTPGGSAETVEKGFRLILKDPNVKAILVNIFGGIVQCDRVANGVVQAYKAIGDIHIPIIVRLQGTNAVIAADIINHSGLKVTSAITLAEAAEKVKEALA